ncbi:hypothetical protein M3Y99_01212500 [Aphelenchoides fujianensis]|nr:hypothetical protein M3Y99_01212500 [Aphelenchoides fujianensis]
MFRRTSSNNSALTENFEADRSERGRTEEAADRPETPANGRAHEQRARAAKKSLPRVDFSVFTAACTSVASMARYDDLLRRYSSSPANGPTPVNGGSFFIQKRREIPQPPPARPVRHYPSILPRRNRAIRDLRQTADVPTAQSPSDEPPVGVPVESTPEPTGDVPQQPQSPELTAEPMEADEEIITVDDPPVVLPASQQPEAEPADEQRVTRKKPPVLNPVSPKTVRRIFVVRDPKTGDIQVDREKLDSQSVEAPVLKPEISLGPRPFEFALQLADNDEPPLPEAQGITTEDLAQAEEAITEFTDHLKELELKSSERTSILKAAGQLVDRMIAVTKRAKDRDANRAEGNIRRWVQNEIDNIVEQRLGMLRKQSTRNLWRQEVDNATDIALAQLCVFREKRTRKQPVLASALAEFNLPYIQTYKRGHDLVTGIQRHGAKFVHYPRVVRAFTDICADYLMKNCHERYFPVNAEKYALLRHCEQLFKIRIDSSFFTTENGTGRLDRRIRTIRALSYKRGYPEIQRKRRPKRARAAAKAEEAKEDEEADGSAEKKPRISDETSGNSAEEADRSIDGESKPKATEDGGADGATDDVNVETVDEEVGGTSGSSAEFEPKEAVVGEASGKEASGKEVEEKPTEPNVRPQPTATDSTHAMRTRRSTRIKSQ